MKNLKLLILLISPVFAGCNLSDKKKTDTRTEFPYSMSVTAPKEYPLEVHLGYLSNNAKGFITLIPKAGIEDNGWTRGGSDGGLRANAIPSHLDLTWISYAEKKFWKVDVDLPAEKILDLFRKGYTDLDGKWNHMPATYDEMVFGVAPGGVVVVCATGTLCSS
ncbi:DUF2931 family protein [Pedobacter sp. NJ-S-72]